MTSSADSPLMSTSVPSGSLTIWGEPEDSCGAGFSAGFSASSFASSWPLLLASHPPLDPSHSSNSLSWPSPLLPAWYSFLSARAWLTALVSFCLSALDTSLTPLYSLPRYSSFLPGSAPFICSGVMPNIFAIWSARYSS